jgi:Zn-dependent oligopeptidase
MGAIAPGVRDEARYDYAAMSPTTVTDATDAALAEAERLIGAVVNAPDPRTYDSTIRPLADAAATVSSIIENRIIP